MASRRRRHHPKGISVVELLVSLGFVAVIGTASGSLIAFTARAEYVSQQRERATGYAEETLEAVMSLATAAFACTPSPCWTQYPAGTSTAGPYHLDTTGWTFVDGDEAVPEDDMFRRAIAITNPDAPDYDRKEVTVTVAWEDRGQHREVQLATFVTAWQP